MSDARWFEIDNDVAAAARHFRKSVEIADMAAPDDDADDGADENRPYIRQMALMHSMQSAHTSLGSTLLRIFELLGEAAPTGDRWHADLIKRAASAFPDRPAILPPPLFAAASETRKFRNVAMRGYEGFDRPKSDPALFAAKVLADGLAEAVAAFRGTIDP